MAYIYDILLNFDKNLIEHFEWEDEDSIKYIKKIIVFKVSSEVIKDIVNKEVVFSDEFIKKIPKYEMNGLKEAGSVCLFTDTFITIGVLIKNNKPVFYSRLLLDEEKEVLDIVQSLDIKDINYITIGNKKREDMNLTRKEKMIKDKLFDEINKLYYNKKYDILLYLYYEYTNKENKEIKEVYTFLKESLNNFNEKHKYLYDILLLSNANLRDK